MKTEPLVDYYKRWEAGGEAGAPRHIRIEGVGKVDEILDVTGPDIVLCIKNHGGLGTPQRIGALVAELEDHGLELVGCHEKMERTLGGAVASPCLGAGIGWAIVANKVAGGRAGIALSAVQVSTFRCGTDSVTVPTALEITKHMPSLFIQSDADYTEIHLPGRKHLSAEGLAHWEKTLDPAHFSRVHKSYIINVRQLQKRA